MKVCHLIIRLSSAGAQRIVFNIIENSDDINYTICCLEPPVDHDFNDQDTKIVNFEEKFKFDPVAIYKMYKFFRNQEFDLIHAHLPYPQALGRVIGKISGTPYIISTHHSVPSNYHPITRFLERITRRMDTVSVAVSEGVERAHTGKSNIYSGQVPEQWCTIYNGIDVKGFKDKVNSADKKKIHQKYNISDELIFLNVSRYVPEKRQRDIIQAISLIDDEVNAKLFIIGRGPLEASLKEAAIKYEVEDRVEVVGFVPREKLSEYYGASDVFVFSSIKEGFGIVLLEAMSSNLPVVATDISGVNEVVEDGRTGILVQPKDPQELSEAMMELSDPVKQQCYGKAGYNRAEQLFSIEKSVEMYLDLYERLVADKNNKEN